MNEKPVEDKIIQITSRETGVFGLSERGNLYQYDPWKYKWEFICESPDVRNKERE